MTTSCLSLYSIETGLIELEIAREEAEDDAAKEACEQAIREYVSREIRKVDGIRHTLLDLRSRAAEAREEAHRAAAFADMLETRERHIKDMCCRVMNEVGRKVLEGTAGSLRVQGNGGLAPLVIQEDVLPDEYQDAIVRIPLNQWRTFKHCGSLWAEINTEPANGRIREALQAGPVPGAHLEPRGEHLRVL